MHGLARGDESLPSNHMKLPRRTVGTSKDVKEDQERKGLVRKPRVDGPTAPASCIAVPLGTGVAGGVCAVHGAAEAAAGSPGEHHPLGPEPIQWPL